MTRVLSSRPWAQPLRSALTVSALITPGLLLGLAGQRVLLFWFSRH
jgi:hypothetical protein